MRPGKRPNTTIVLNNRFFSKYTLRHDFSHSSKQIINLRLIRPGKTWIILYGYVRRPDKHLLAGKGQDKNRPPIRGFGIDAVFTQ